MPKPDDPGLLVARVPKPGRRSSSTDVRCAGRKDDKSASMPQPESASSNGGAASRKDEFVRLITSGKDGGP